MNLKLSDYKLYKYLRHITKNVAGLTLLFTIIITVGSTLIKLICYLIERGYIEYFRLPESVIDLSSDNFFYRVIAEGIVFIFVGFICTLPYWIIKSEMKRGKKIFLMLLIHFIPFAYIIITLPFSVNQFNFQNAIDWIMLIALALLFDGVLYLWGYFLIYDKRAKNKVKKGNNVSSDTDKEGDNTNENKSLALKRKLTKTIACVFVLVVLESIVFIAIGVLKAHDKKEFKVVEYTPNEYYAVIYETSDKFIMAKCETKDGSESFAFSKSEIRKEVAKEGIEYTFKIKIED